MNIRLMHWKTRLEIAGIVHGLWDATLSLDAPRFEQVALLAAQMLLASTRSGAFLSNARSVLFLLAAGLQPIGSIVWEELVAFSKKNQYPR
jgi:hypothetical protein